MGEDRISLLPDPLLCQILSELPTKNIVSTSVLSKRWKTLWLSVPFLDLDDLDFFDYNSFVTFVDNFLDFSKDSCLQQLKLSLQGHEDDDYSSYIKPWIDTATMRKVQHLGIQLRPRCIVRELMPLSIYICETLVCLKLSYVSLPDFEYVSLPGLRIMHLEMVRCFNDDTLLEKLISSCSVLEDLKVVRNVEEGAIKVLRVRSQTLNSLVLVLHGDQTWDESDADADDWEVVIDAPRLDFFSLKDNWSTSFVINQLPSSAKVDIDVAEVGVLIPESVVMNFLIGLSSVRDMTISRTTFKIIISNYEKSELRLQFPHVTRFHASFYNSDLEKLPDFLDSCPNLRFLVLELQEFKKNEHVSISSFVPESLRSSLEYVEMKRPISGAEAEIKLVKYFLENSVMLKKFKLRLSCRKMNEESIILNELSRIRRCSASCEVIVEVEET